MPKDIQGLLAEQVRYYDDRAERYDDWYFRRGRHDKGPEFNRAWLGEMARLEAAVQTLPITGQVLELACGTGLWTRWLVPKAKQVVAVDSSEKMLALNRSRVASDRVQYVQADLFQWDPTPGDRFDAVFIGFFLSHIPPELLRGFLARLRHWLAPYGLVSFCDDLDGPDRPYSGDTVPDGPSFAHRRRLSGREYTIVKLFYSPEDLEGLLRRLGWDAKVHTTGRQFLYGTARSVDAGSG